MQQKTQVVQRSSKGPSPTATRAGKFGDFHIVENVDRRPVFKSYLSENLKTSTACVVKILAVKPPADAVLVGRFLDAGKRWMAMRHNNIARVLDFGVTDKIPFISVEYVPGPNNRRLTVASYLKLNQKGRASQNRCIDWARQIAAALIEAHKNHLVHGTLRPDNVLINAEGSPVLTDFGLAASLSLQAELGGEDKAETACYVAPELRTRPVNPDVSCDIYSFGALMYRLLTGKIPSDKQPSPSTVIAGLNPMWDHIVDICMSPVAGNRYPDAEALAADVAVLAEKITGQSEMQDAIVISTGKPTPAPSEINYEGLDATGGETSDLKARRRARQTQVLQRMNPKDSLNAAIIASDAMSAESQEEDAIVLPDTPVGRPGPSASDEHVAEAVIIEHECATATLVPPMTQATAAGVPQAVIQSEQIAQAIHEEVPTSVGAEHIEEHHEEAPTPVAAEHMEEHHDPLASISQSSGSGGRRRYMRQNSGVGHAVKIIAIFFVLAVVILIAAMMLLNGEAESKKDSKDKYFKDTPANSVADGSQNKGGTTPNKISATPPVSQQPSPENSAKNNGVAAANPDDIMQPAPKELTVSGVPASNGPFKTIRSIPFGVTVDKFDGMKKAELNYGGMFKTVKVEWYERTQEPTTEFQGVPIEKMKFGFSAATGKLTDVYIQAKGKSSYKSFVSWGRSELDNEEAVDDYYTWTINYSSGVDRMSLKMQVCYDEKANMAKMWLFTSQ